MTRRRIEDSADEVEAVSEVLKDEAARLMDESENLRRLVADLRRAVQEESDG